MSLLSNVNVTLISSFEEASMFMEWCRQGHEVIAVDTETTGIRFGDRIRTVQVGDRDTGWVIPFERGGWGALFKEAINLLRGTTFLMHNFTFDQNMLYHEGLELPDDRVVDTRIRAHVIDPTRPTGLKPLSDRLIGPYSSHGQKLLDEAMKINKWTWETIPVETPEFWFYGGLDTVLTCRIWEHQREEMERFTKIYDLEYASQIVIKRMVRRGVACDLGYVNWKLSQLATEINELRARATAEFGIANLTSNDQVAKRLMDDGWKPAEYTSTGKPSMGKKIVAHVDHPLAQLMMECKHLEKMRSTQYLGGYEEFTDSNGFIHPSVNPLGARTGRMSVQSPALQTLHRDAIVRDAFVPREGRRFIFADYDQMEVRLAAHYSGDPNYAHVINTSADIHRSTAAQIYGVSEDAVTKKMRATTKNAVYAIIYGAGIDKFSATAGITPDEGREFLSLYHRAFPGVKKLQETIQTMAGSRLRDEGMAYIMSPAGRRHRMREDEVYVRKDNGAIDGSAYKLLNYLIQGTGADVLKQAIVDADRAGIGDYLVLLVHDEMGWDVPVNELRDVEQTIKECMEVHDAFNVPLTVGVGTYSRWGDKYRDDGEKFWMPGIEELISE